MFKDLLGGAPNRQRRKSKRRLDENVLSVMAFPPSEAENTAKERLSPIAKKYFFVLTKPFLTVVANVISQTHIIFEIP